MSASLPADSLRRRCDPAQFEFATTAELEGLETALGQSRAQGAIEFGVGMRREGYNLFAMGPEGIGRRTLVRREHVLVIVDHVRGATAAERVVSRYHVAPGLAITRESDTRFSIEDGTTTLAWLISNAHEARVTMTPHSDEYARATDAATLELCTTSDHPVVVAIAPADVPPEPSLAALARFAAARGVHVPVRELASAK